LEKGNVERKEGASPALQGLSLIARGEGIESKKSPDYAAPDRTRPDRGRLKNKYLLPSQKERTEQAHQAPELNGKTTVEISGGMPDTGGKQ